MMKGFMALHGEADIPGGYRLLGLKDQGSFGQVKLAHHPGLGTMWP